MKKMMYDLFKDGKTSDDMPFESDMYYAMYAYETYGDATRDNSFQDLVFIGKNIDEEV